ncbi:AsmA family protein [Cellvibrio fibrivorans]|uniref:AsmA family protein n=1 Tax=Cellvibrio fibrivorans TaxID=126350 RepID=UPI00286C5F2C|nr:AsmA family protein [Cellvibrio fibrivorans]
MPLFYLPKRPLVSTLVGVIAAAVLLISVSLLSVILFSESLLRALIEVKGSQFLEREVAVDGKIKVEWHWAYTHIHVEKLRLRNATDFSEPDMARVELVNLQFKPLSLLRGYIDISEVSIIAPEIFLERKSVDVTNWNFPSLTKTHADEMVPDGRYDFPVIDQLKISRGRIFFKDGFKGLDLDLKLDSVTANDKTTFSTGPGFEKGYAVSGTGKLQGQDFSIVAFGGSLSELRDSSVPFPLRIQLEMGDTKVSIDGRFQDPIKMEGVDAVLKIEGANLADIFYLTAIPLPPTPNYTLEGQLTKSGTVWAYRDFKGQVGSSDLAGTLAYAIGGERGFLTADLTSSVLDAADLGGFIGLSPNSDSRKSTKLIPDVPLSRERLLATDLNIHLKAEKVEAPNLPFKGMDVHFDLRAGVLKLDPLNLVLADGRVEGTIEIDANPALPPMKMNLKLRQLNLTQFFKGTRFESNTNGLFGGKLSLAGEGKSLADVLATSNGDLALIMSGGEISLLLIEAADLDIGQALPLFLGKDKSTRINCGVMNFNVKNGLLSSNVVALDTKDSLLVGNVDIDLKDEMIDARLDAKPKDNSLLSLRIPITITGDLKSPSIGIDKEKTANRGVTAIVLGALLTPFAALLAFVEDGDAPDANCRALIRDARK